MSKSDRNVILYGSLLLALIVAATIGVIAHSGLARPHNRPTGAIACTLEVGTITGDLLLTWDRRVTYVGSAEWFTLDHMGEC